MTTDGAVRALGESGHFTRDAFRKNCRYRLGLLETGLLTA